MTTYFDSVWDALEDTTEDAAAMRLRSAVMQIVVRKITAMQVSQRVAAQSLGITQPRLNELMTGKISRWSLDALINLADRAGIGLSIGEQGSREPTARERASVREAMAAA